VFALLPLLACLPLGAQDAEAQKKFEGTWEEVQGQGDLYYPREGR
jgi:hypothetical protein